MSSYIGSCCGELEGDAEHALGEERHPRRAVGLLEAAAGRQRCAAVEHADVVEAEEAALEHVAPGRVLAVDPPGEVHEQLLERALQPGDVALAALLELGLVDEQRRPGVHRRVHVAEVPLVGRAAARSGGGTARAASARAGPWRSRCRPSPARPCGTRGPTTRTTGTPTCRASR